MDSNKYLYTRIRSSIIHNSLKMEITQVSINRWMDKQNVINKAKHMGSRLFLNTAGIFVSDEVRSMHCLRTVSNSLRWTVKTNISNTKLFKIHYILIISILYFYQISPIAFSFFFSLASFLFSVHRQFLWLWIFSLVCDMTSSLKFISISFMVYQSLSKSFIFALKTLTH